MIFKILVGAIVLIAIVAVAYGIWKWMNLQRQQKQNHEINIVGALHNLRIPKQDLLAMRNKKLANYQSLAQFMCNHLKSNKVAMNVKLRPIAKNPSQKTDVQLNMAMTQQTKETHSKPA